MKGPLCCVLLFATALHASLETIVVHGARKSPSIEGKGVVFDGVEFLEEHAYFAEDLALQFLGQESSELVEREVIQAISQLYQAQAQAYGSITASYVAEKELHIQIEEITLGKVVVQGNRYFTPSEIASSIRVRPGQTIVQKHLLEDLAWINQNPFRRVDARLVPGEKKGSADIELQTQDRWPYRVYTGTDNTGTLSTQTERIFWGFNFSQSYIVDSQVSYQFSCSPNWNRFFAHTVSTRIPCPWRHTFVFWGGYAQDEPKVDEIGTHARGVEWQVDGRYRVPILDVPSLLQTLIVGYDFKQTHNHKKTYGVTTFEATADINQFLLGYELGFSREGKKATLVVEALGNPGGITTKNHTKDYEQFRFDAKASYIYLTVHHDFSVTSPKGWCLSYDLDGQVSSANLLTSEQLDMTGTAGVRGFAERILFLDNGLLAHLVLETPRLDVAKLCGSKTLHDSLYFHLFFDGGVGADHQKSSGERKFKGLASVGPGVRYTLSRYLSARFDYGVQLWHRGFFNPTSSRCHFAAMLSY